MFESTEKKNYIPPVAEAITILVENEILQNSGAPSGIPGSSSTTPYEDIAWN